MTTTPTPRAVADRDRLNGRIRLIVPDPDHPDTVTVSWLTDTQATALAADLTEVTR